MTLNASEPRKLEPRPSVEAILAQHLLSSPGKRRTSIELSWRLADYGYGRWARAITAYRILTRWDRRGLILWDEKTVDVCREYELEKFVFPKRFPRPVEVTGRVLGSSHGDS